MKTTLYLVLTALLVVGIHCHALRNDAVADAARTAWTDRAPPHSAPLWIENGPTRPAAVLAYTAPAEDCPANTVLWEGSCRSAREPGACVACPANSTAGPDGLCVCPEGVHYFPTFVAGCQKKFEGTLNAPIVTPLALPVGGNVTLERRDDVAVPLFKLQMTFSVSLDGSTYLALQMRCSAGRTTFLVQAAADRRALCGSTVVYQRVVERTGLVTADADGAQAQTYSTQLTVYLNATEATTINRCSFTANVRSTLGGDTDEVQVGWWNVVPPATTSSTAASSSSARRSSGASSASSLSAPSRSGSDTTTAPNVTSSDGALTPSARKLLIVFGVLDCVGLLAAFMTCSVYRYECRKLERIKRQGQQCRRRHEPVTPAHGA